MSAKLKSLKDGMLAGIAAEKTKAAPVDRFALAEQAITSHPRGLLGQPARPAFSAESQAETSSERRVVKIPLERLQENPLNARRIYDQQIVQERAASIATHGQQTPAWPHRIPPSPAGMCLSTVTTVSAPSPLRARPRWSASSRMACPTSISTACRLC